MSDMYRDVYVSVDGTLNTGAAPAVKAKAGFFWATTRPSEVTISVQYGEKYEVWSVGRSTFIAASMDWARGAWIGAGNFGLVYTSKTNAAMLAFKPVWMPKDRHAILLVPDPKPIEDFIEHTCRIVPPGDSESAVNLAAVDKAIGKILEREDRG